MAEDAKTDFSVVQSLFGINPEQLAMQREQIAQQMARADAERRAQLGPQQLMGATMMEGASNLGRALAPAVQGAFGMKSPVDPQMKFAQTMQSIMQDLQQSGADMSDPVQTQAEVGKRLIAAGYNAQGMTAIENARRQAQEAAKAKADREKAQAETYKLYAQAAKDLSEQDPVAKAVASGHIPSAEWAKYLASGRDPSVISDTKDYMKVEQADGVWMVNKRNPTDKFRLGALTPRDATAPGTTVKPPAGYRYTPDGNLEKIPGGPAAEKFEMSQKQDKNNLTGISADLDNMLDTIKALREHKGLGEITGSIYGKFPGYVGQQAANAFALYKNLEPEIAFGKLQSMREASKTGGALGQVSNQEETMLKNSIVALDRSQDTPQFKAQLDRLEAQITKSKKNLEDAYNLKYGSSSASGAPTMTRSQLVEQAKAAKAEGKLNDWFRGLTPEQKRLYNTGS